MVESMVAFSQCFRISQRESYMDVWVKLSSEFGRYEVSREKKVETRVWREFWRHGQCRVKKEWRTEVVLVVLVQSRVLLRKDRHERWKAPQFYDRYSVSRSVGHTVTDEFCRYMSVCASGLQWFRNPTKTLNEDDLSRCDDVQSSTSAHDGYLIKMHLSFILPCPL